MLFALRNTKYASIVVAHHQSHKRDSVISFDSLRFFLPHFLSLITRPRPPAPSPPFFLCIFRRRTYQCWHCWLIHREVIMFITALIAKELGLSRVKELNPTVTINGVTTVELEVTL